MIREVTFVTLNVRGLGSPLKRYRFLRQMARCNADIVAIQETYLDGKLAVQLKKMWVADVYATSYSTFSRGVAILVRKGVPFLNAQVELDPDGRYIFLQGTLYGEQVLIINFYAPNINVDKFLDMIVVKLSTNSTVNVMLLGDLNIPLVPDEDRQSNAPFRRDKESQEVCVTLEVSGLVDVWRFRNPGKREFTFFSPRHKAFSRLDYIFWNTASLSRIVDVSFLPRLISDHCPVKLSSRWQENKYDVRLWRTPPGFFLSVENCQALESYVDEVCR